MNSPIFRIVSLSLIAVLLSVPGIVLGDTVEKSFDHARDGNVTQKLEVSPGDKIRITITQTCPSQFEYVQKAFPSQQAQAQPMGCTVAKLEQQGFCILESKTLEFTHSTDASSYLVEVERKSGQTEPQGITQAMFSEFANNNCSAPSQWSATPKKLPDRQYILNVDSTWALGMSGGLTVSSVTDPRYAVITDPMSMTTPPGSIVIQNPDAEDNYSLGFAGFVHMHNRNWRWKDISIAPTFGLGIGDQNTLNGFVGVGFGAKDIGYINVGWNWRQVDRLPTGQQLGQPPINENVLADLPNRVDDGWFIGFSFRFMSPGESFFTGKTVQPDAQAAP